MLKKEITYTNFDGDEVSKTLYFNLTKAELIMFQNSYKGGVMGVMEDIVKSQDNVKIFEYFTKIIKLAYGERNDKGEFVKSEEASENFIHTEAYSSLFMELFTTPEYGAKFIEGILPKDLNKTEQAAVTAKSTENFNN